MTMPNSKLTSQPPMAPFIDGVPREPCSDKAIDVINPSNWRS